MLADNESRYALVGFALGALISGNGEGGESHAARSEGPREYEGRSGPTLIESSSPRRPTTAAPTVLSLSQQSLR